MTDEINTCRRYSDDGICAEDDFVFSLGEQQQQFVDTEKRQVAISVKAGHVEIVGNSITAPTKLIAILQEEGIMRDTPPARQKDLAQLLSHLYLDALRPLVQIE